MEPLAVNLLRVVVVSDRAAVHGFFARLPDAAVVSASFGDLDSGEPVADASVVVVDVALDPPAGIELCAALHASHPQLPIVALLCCPQSVNPWQLQSLFASGVASVLDLQTSLPDALRTLRSAAGGAAVLHVQLRRSHRYLLHELFVARDERTSLKLRLLGLVCLGLPDHEIGRRLHLSPHTVKHQIEALRREVKARNRIELAAWAGRNGFYAAEADAEAS